MRWMIFHFMMSKESDMGIKEGEVGFGLIYVVFTNHMVMDLWECLAISGSCLE